MSEKGKFLRHEPCEACGSSDAKAIYSNGTAYCFSCETWSRWEGEPIPVRRKQMGGLIQGKPITKTLRGITEETLKKYGYQYGSYGGRKVHIAPYYFKGELVAQHLRTPDKEFPWLGQTGHLELFGQHLWRNEKGKCIIITEGELDCMSIAQVFGLKWPVVSIPSGVNSAVKYIKQNLEFLEGYNEIILAFDADEPGRKAVHECAPLFTPGKVKVIDWSIYGVKDANDLLKQGKTAEIAAARFEAKAYRPDGIISGTDLWDIVLQPPIPGYSIPYPKLNSMLMGIRKGEITLFTAGSGIGKSTLVNELGYYLMTKHNLTFGVVALEESIKRTAERYMSIYLNYPLHISRENISEETLREAFDATVGSGRMYLYDHFGSLEGHHLMSKLKFMAKGLDVDFIILDHISIVVSGLDESGIDERKDIDKLMTNIRSLAQETNVGILAVVHLKRPNQGKSFNEGRQVSLSDLRGSGSLEQLSDTVIALERDQQGENPNISLVRVLKNRYVGITGIADLLEYNTKTGRLLAKEDIDLEFTSEEGGEVDF